MIDLDLLRRDADAVRAGLTLRGVPLEVVDEILAADKERREMLGKVEGLRARRNALAAEIGKAKASGGDAAEASAEAGRLKQELPELEQKLEQAQTAMQERLAELPNLPDARVPPGGKEANRVVKVWGEVPALPEKPRDHVELASGLGLVDYERGTKLAGSGFWIYRGLGAALEWALLDFFNREHYKAGYTFVLPPHLLLDACGYGAGQFPKFRDAVFPIGASDDDRARFLLPTAETAILNIHADETLDAADLPLKMFAYTPCYRREAGSYRTNERGTVRGHQFNKVEMFQFTAPEDADAALHELVARAESLVEALGLHYRTTLLAAHDVSHSMRMTYDVEVYLPSIGGYKEISSVSWAGDYQARRANIRYRAAAKGGEKKKAGYVHTLNGSGLATSRLVPAILEQHQQADGSVVVPAPLRPWIGVDVLVPPAR